MVTFLVVTIVFLRLLDWERQDTWEVTSLWDMVESESTENIPVVEVLPVVCIMKESTWTNSKLPAFVSNVSSHPGHFGKATMRHFHLKRNREYTPVVNVDRLWTLVSKSTRLNNSKDKAPVIDATKAVIYIILITNNRATSRFSARADCQRSLLLWNARRSPSWLRRKSRKPVVPLSSPLEKDERSSACCPETNWLNP